MNRRQKIIVSVTGIFLVLLVIVGLTYAYFLTKINGNENTKSISVTTANLALVYGDGNGTITGTNIMPGTTLDKKEFTVSNEGNATTDYVVVIEDVKVTNVSDGSTTTFESNDFVYTLTCTSDGEDCTGVDTETTFPITGGILVGNSIEVGKTHTYELIVTYKETGLDQSNDMNKSLEAKVNISDVNQMENPFKTGVTTVDNVSLTYNIINNAKTKKNGTMFVNTSPSQVAEETSLDNWELGTEENVYLNSKNIVSYAKTDDAFFPCYNDVYDPETGEFTNDCSGVTSYTSCTNDVEGKYVYDNNTMETYFVNKCENGKIVLGTAKYEKVLSMTNDDYGTSYYYRGKVEDNYVNFAGMCWRIVRIVGDGSIKLILEDQYTTCNDTEDTDGAETVDYAYTGNWNIGSGNYGYDSSSKSTSGYAINKMSYLKPVTNANSSMVKAFFDFQTNKLSEYLNKLKSGDWCLADTAYSTRSIDLTTTPLTSDEINARHLARSSFYYDSYVRLIGNSKKSPTLKCNGTILNEFAEVTNVSSQEPMYVSTITADEIMYAGGKYNSSNYNYYLINNYAANSHSFYSLSPSYFESSVDLVVDVRSDGIMYNTSVYNQSFRPSVSLAAGTQITGGDGTITTPYEIKID